MKLRIPPFEELDLAAGTNTLFVDDPCVYSALVMRLLNLTGDPEAKEPLALVGDGKALDISKEVIVISDPLCRDMADTKIITSLRKHIFKRIMEDPQASLELDRKLLEASEYVKDAAYSMPFDIEIADTVEADAFIKAMDPKPDMSECKSPEDRLLHTAKVISALGSWSVAVFVGARSFLTEAGAQRLFGALAELPLNVVFIDRSLPAPVVKGEIRTLINSDFWDCRIPGFDPSPEK